MNRLAWQHARDSANPAPRDLFDTLVAAPWASLIWTTDGNLVLRGNDGTELWRAGYAGTAAKLCFEPTGRLAIYNGGGGVIKPDRPLDDQHGPVTHVARALDAAAPALARGETIPDEARALMMARAMPDGLYRVMGDLGWRYQAYRNHVAQRTLRARPLDG